MISPRGNLGGAFQPFGVVTKIEKETHTFNVNVTWNDGRKWPYAYKPGKRDIVAIGRKVE